VSRIHIQEDVKPDEHTVSACVSNDMPGVLPPVVIRLLPAKNTRSPSWPDMRCMRI
jgi:hypothetical protein